MARVAIILVATLFHGAALAGAYLQHADSQRRHDIQLLADHGLIIGPTSNWPLPVNVLAGLRSASVDTAPANVQRAYGRIMRHLAWIHSRPVRTQAQVGLASSPVQLRSFDPSPRQKGKTTLAMEGAAERGGFRLAVSGVLDPRDEQQVNLDGSFAALRLGNWIVSVGAQDRWWGPGRDGSLILGNNARPVPGLSLERDNPLASTQPLVRWLGPWQLTTFIGQLESQREAPRAKLFGMRLSFRPLQGLEVGLSRTAQWGGAGRPQSAGSFWNMLIGRSNYGDTGGTDIVGGDANQLAGYDVRWVSPVGDAPYAVYAQLIGEDEAGHLPYQYIGLMGTELWGTLGALDYRLHAEVADTVVDFFRDPPSYNVAYEHSGYVDGYRYRGRSLGHTMDGDGLMLSLGLQLLAASGSEWRFLARHTELNRGGRERRAGVSPQKGTMTGLDVTHGFDWLGNRMTVNGGLDQAKKRDGKTRMKSRAWLSMVRTF